MLKLICPHAVIAACLAIVSVPAAAQNLGFTEVSDPTRGVIFYSVQMSDTAIDRWQTTSGEFTSADRIGLGLSALYFEGSDSHEYILWVRHEGRRWLTPFGIDNVVAFLVDGERLALASLRSPQPFVTAGAMVEKIELALSDSQLDALIEGEEVVVIIRTPTGEIRKALSTEERAALASLQARLQDS